MPTDGRYPALVVSPQQKREMTLAALLDQLDGLAAQSLVMVVIEDVHWIDPTSLDLLDRLVVRAARMPVLLAVTFRPELEPTWVGQPHVTMLPLSRLGRHDSAAIISGVTKDKPLPDIVTDQILAHTDGVPLFIEELTRTLLDSKLLRATGGPLRARLTAAATRDPDHAARLVGRPTRPAWHGRYVAQIGAAIGRSSPTR